MKYINVLRLLLVSQVSVILKVSHLITYLFDPSIYLNVATAILKMNESSIREMYGYPHSYLFTFYERGVVINLHSLFHVDLNIVKAQALKDKPIFLKRKPEQRNCKLLFQLFQHIITIKE